MLSYILKSSTRDEIYLYSKKILSEQFEIGIGSIKRTLENDSTTVKKMLKVFNELFCECSELQALGRKGKIRYIHLFYLKSCFFTGRYEIQINLFDKSSYLDDWRLYRLWNPELFITQYHKDLEVFESRASNQLIGFDYPKFQEIKMKYYDAYLVLIGQFILKEVYQVIELEAYMRLEKDDDIQFIFGGFMEKGIQVHPPLEVKVCDIT